MSAYKKAILAHPNFYIAKFTKRHNISHLIFIHGGPGLNCGVLEYLIKHEDLLDSLNYNILLYDQRACERSKYNSEMISHNDNVDDLNEIITYLIDKEISIAYLVGHSYGAKLLADYYKKFKPSILAVFLSTATSIITPRLNNLIFDLASLKISDRKLYQTILEKMDGFNLEKLWSIKYLFLMH